MIIYRLCIVLLLLAAVGLAGCQATDDSSSAKPKSLEGATWQLESYGNPEAPSSVTDEVMVTARFDPEEGKVSGKSGCNNYSAPYEVDGSTLSVGPAISTMMMCDPAAMEIEQAYLGGLQSAESYAIDDGALEIAYEGGQVLRFAPLEPLALEGTEWIARNYNNGREAVVSIVIDTEITAQFVDGTVTGSTGCNSYNADYEIDGDTISIGTPASTRMFCGEPEGTMEQEADYLAALEMAETYSIEGDRLEFRTAAGSLVATYIAASP